ncbi:MAG: hypothetical protein AM325_007295 [Candidatus Thorarchaeota archaeon SMTZ1-45]|nr:MAG: hypothetical protein AM325_09025 [Candidatus Thorarchaeota archaeon SMTZ1-45]
MYEYEGTSPAKIHDELTLPDNYSMEDIKSRVKSWLASPMGSEYVMEVVHERHIILSKSKHDMRVCCVGCITTCASIILVVMIVIGTVGIYDYYALMNAMILAMGIVMMIMVIFVAIFCLRPQKAVIEMRIGNEIPIKVSILRSGELEKSAHEYFSLRNSIHREPGHGGPSLEF